MTKVIIMKGSSLDNYYEQTMDYLHVKYHTYPKKLENLRYSADDKFSMDYCENLALNTAEEVGIEDGVPLGKLVC